MVTCEQAVVKGKKKHFEYALKEWQCFFYHHLLESRGYTKSISCHVTLIRKDCHGR